jgi:hypothetical protein
MELSSLNDAFLDVLVESGTRQEVQFRRIQHRCTPSATVAQTVVANRPARLSGHTNLHCVTFT